MTLDSRSGGGKRPGKTEWAGRRRPATRSAGFQAHPDTTGGELQIALVSGWTIDGDGAVRVTFSFPAMEPGTLLGFGGWMSAPPEASVRLEGFDQKLTLTEPAAPDWSKFGSVWYSDGEPLTFSLLVETCGSAAEIALYDVQAGALAHDFYDTDKAGIEPERHARLMSNMWQFAPEAIFLSPDIDVTVSEPEIFGDSKLVDVVAWIYLKSCNRCARFLPINVDNERLQLSFSNHCVARRPCKHATFGRLTDIETDEVFETEYGFQLECRFCKKFTVNAQHNPQRSAAQMKEDAARRRAIETLLTALYAGSPSLSYRGESSGRELVDEVFARFEGRCFKCGTRLATAHDMHLDHTRPLALLWPLDGSATCLCATCNSGKT